MQRRSRAAALAQAGVCRALKGQVAVHEPVVVVARDLGALGRARIAGDLDVRRDVDLLSAERSRLRVERVDDIVDGDPALTRALSAVVIEVPLPRSTGVFDGDVVESEVNVLDGVGRLEDDMKTLLAGVRLARFDGVGDSVHDIRPFFRVKRVLAALEVVRGSDPQGAVSALSTASRRRVGACVTVPGEVILWVVILQRSALLDGRARASGGL